MMTLQLDPVIAHRGASAYAPENTIAAFQRAKAQGARWVEFDVMLAADGEAIVMHDETLNRTTNGSGDVSKYTYLELSQLDAGSWFSPEYKDEKIPRFIDVIDCLAENNLAANVEIKPCPGFEIETVNSVVDIIKQHWPEDLAAPLLSSFSLPCLQQVRKLDPSLLLGLLLHDWRQDWQELADALNCQTVHLSKSIVNAERITEIKQSGRKVLSYTVNNPEQARKLYAMGVDAVFTDYPDLILSSCNEVIR